MKTVLAAGVAAAALVSAASADVTVTFTNQTWTGFNFSDLTAAYGGFTGSLTGAVAIVPAFLCVSAAIWLWGWRNIPDPPSVAPG